jgi:NADPH:quinone reductase-like Zn-dependent oxidoreductase
MNGTAISIMNQTSKVLGFAVSLALAAALLSVSEAQSAAAQHQQAVLVTGAGSGIGRKITEKLAADGYFVYATARKDEDLKALGALKNVQARAPRRDQAAGHRRCSGNR